MLETNIYFIKLNQTVSEKKKKLEMNLLNQE